MDWQEMYDILHEALGISEEALEIACAVSGCNEETMERILFYKTGWHSFSGYLNEEEDE